MFQVGPAGFLTKPVAEFAQDSRNLKNEKQKNTGRKCSHSNKADCFELLWNFRWVHDHGYPGDEEQDESC